MQFSYAAILAFVAVVSAQTIESEQAQLPACALTCLSSAISAAGCSTTDYTCQCTTKIDDITSSASPCILKACSVEEATSVQSITAEICKLGLAQSASSSGGSSASSAASSASSAISSDASSAVSASTASDSTGASSLSSATAAASSSASKSLSQAAATTSAAASSTQSASDASQIKAGLGVMGAAVVAAMAL